MYHSVEVKKLSPHQHSRLRNHHRVKVELGSGEKLHLTQEQIKRLHKAKTSRNGGALISFDPYQKDSHYPNHRKGRGTPIMEQQFSGNDLAHFVGAHKSSEPLMNKEISLNDVKDAGKRAKKLFGLGVRHKPKSVKKRGRPKKEGGKIGDDVKRFFTRTLPSGLIHQGIPATASFLGGVGTAEIGGVGSIPAGIAGKALADKVGKQTGLGVKHRGRPRKGQGIFGSMFDKAVEELVGKENKKAGYELIKKHGKPLFEKGLAKAEKLAVEKGMPVDASLLASNLVSSYVAHPSTFQNASNLVGEIEKGALTGEGVKHIKRGRGARAKKDGEGVKPKTVKRGMGKRRGKSCAGALAPAGHSL